MNEELIIKYIVGEATPEEAKLISEWIMASSENLHYYNELKQIWDNAGIETELKTINTEAAWNKVKNKITIQTTNIPQTANLKTIYKRPNLAYTLLRIAAILIIVIGLYYLLIPKHIHKIMIASTNEPVQKTLPDGSMIVLNKNSKISYSSNFGKTQRSITLIGEAYFIVTPNKEKPFIISANNLLIKVVGTSFNVNTTLPNSIEVIVNSGKVLLYTKNTNNNSATLLTQGNKGIFNTQTQQITTEKEFDENKLTWKTGIFRFNHTKLIDVIKTISKEFNIPIEISDNKLDTLPLTGTYKKTTTDSVLEVIKLTFDLKIKKEGQKIIIFDGNN